MDQFVGEAFTGFCSGTAVLDHGDADAPVELTAAPFGGTGRLEVGLSTLGGDREALGGLAAEIDRDAGELLFEHPG